MAYLFLALFSLTSMVLSAQNEHERLRETNRVLVQALQELSAGEELAVGSSCIFEDSRYGGGVKRCEGCKVSFSRYYGDMQNYCVDQSKQRCEESNGLHHGGVMHTTTFCEKDLEAICKFEDTRDFKRDGVKKCDGCKVSFKRHGVMLNYCLDQSKQRCEELAEELNGLHHGVMHTTTFCG